MSLAWRVASIVIRALLRASLLLAALFLTHLVLSRAVPEFRATLEAMERRPSLERDLQQLERKLESDLDAARDLERRLEERSRAASMELTQQLATWEQRLAELTSQRAGLLERLDALRLEREAACNSYNPLEWWVCRRLERSFAGLSERLTPLIEQLERDAALVEASITKLRDQLRILEDPELDDRERLERLGRGDPDHSALSLDVAKRRIEATRQSVKKLEGELLQIAKLEASPSGWLLREWREVRVSLLLIVLGVMLLPVAQRALNYFVLMPLVSRLGAPLRLSRTDAGTARCGPSRRSLVLSLAEGQHASVRSEYARPVKGRASSRLLYRLDAPFISYAAGLRLLTRVEGEKNSTVELTLAAPEDPNAYLTKIDLEDHPGFVIHPRHLVGIIGDLQLSTRWRPFSVHAWATWQLRYILLSGTGTLIVEGCGDVIATAASEDGPTKLEQKLVIGFDSRLAYWSARTEVFWPYFFGKTPLVDDVFRGNGFLLWQKSTSQGAKNPVARSFEALFSALGKLLGF